MKLLSILSQTLIKFSKIFKDLKFLNQFLLLLISSYSYRATLRSDAARFSRTGCVLVHAFSRRGVILEHAVRCRASITLLPPPSSPSLPPPNVHVGTGVDAFFFCLWL